MGYSPRAKWIIGIVSACVIAALWIGLRIATGSPVGASLAKHDLSEASSPPTSSAGSPASSTASGTASSLAAVPAHEAETPATHWIRVIDRAERHALSGAAVLVTRVDMPPRPFVAASDGIVNVDLVDADVLHVEREGWFPLRPMSVRCAARRRSKTSSR